MNKNDEILYLNQKIKKLLTENEQLVQENGKLAKQFVDQNSNLDRYSQMNVQFQFDLEREVKMRKAIFEAHQNQKTKFLNLYGENSALKESIRSLEKTIQSSIQQNHPTFCIESLKSENEKLKIDLDEAFKQISKLEFEVDTVPFYEAENERLNAEVIQLRLKCERNANSRIEIPKIPKIEIESNESVGEIHLLAPPKAQQRPSMTYDLAELKNKILQTAEKRQTIAISTFK